MSDMITLESPDRNSSVQIDPQRGGRIAAINVNGSQLLVEPTADPLAWGCYPMVPFAGRIRDGRLDFDGRTYALPHTLGPHAMHGYGFTSSWTKIDDAAIRYTFEDPWPFAGAATQRFVLADDRLEIHLIIDARERQPINVGWHPWFRRDIGGTHPAELDFAPGLMYERDNDGLPSGKTLHPPRGPWDDCFTALRSDPILRWGSFAVTLSSSADHWVVYDETSHALCVEPQTGPPNDANDNPRVLESGQSMTVRFTLEW